MARNQNKLRKNPYINKLSSKIATQAFVIRILNLSQQIHFPPTIENFINSQNPQNFICVERFTKKKL